MNSFAPVAPFAARTFLPAETDLCSLPVLEEHFGRLERELGDARSAPALEAWLGHYDEVQAAMDEVRAKRYIAMTAQTDDPEREKAYLEILTVVDPWRKARQMGILRAFCQHPCINTLPDSYAVFRRSVEMQVRLFCEENIARETEEARLSQQYQKVIGAMTILFDGKEQTLAQVGRVLEEPDRARRRTAWEQIAWRRGQDAETLEEIFDRLLALRREIAAGAGFPDYREYAFARAERFDYTPGDCLEFGRAIEEAVVPLCREMDVRREKRLGVERLRPWDLAVDIEGKPPLRPFRTSGELLEKTEKVIRALDEPLGDLFGQLRRDNLVDLENRKGKAPGGYQSTLSEARLPFIFMNAVGTHRDLETLLHESGHAFHTLLARTQPLYAYRSAPLEFCEVASMSMELLAAPYLGEFYGEEELRRARRNHLEGILRFLPWMAVVDGFQHWLYTHPDHSRDERAASWVELLRRFGGREDWSGYEEVLRSLWHRQLHIFEYPFYYIEYGIAQLGALGIWRRSLIDPAGALEAYRRALAFGGSKPLPELFAAAGVPFSFGQDNLRSLVAAAREELERLGGATGGTEGAL
ncbi:M3 family oligoendopeptidase [Methylacidimicrobium sp. B4]|uniref:M3 family oligoendopeptidase n=1 Tax=Methylacidimicrobium sp. B4 TaxID=2796139 RepID=UPI001A8FA47B|nr:M3 family oligoendopeptidase [Methylacidimicrobium sp. B4]QSR83809.1 M3 family oligoendopeptidase [Methylacidimicrobium sp. B4]